MSLGEADAKFPTANLNIGYPPPPSAENPGQVFPKSSPKEAEPPVHPFSGPELYFANPYLMHCALKKVDHAFAEAIQLLENEEDSNENMREANPLLEKFRQWRDELTTLCGGVRTPPIKHVQRTPSPERGGMFVE